MSLRVLVMLASLSLVACAGLPPASDQKPSREGSKPAAHIVQASWSELSGWRDAGLTPAWGAMQQSCTVLKKKPGWAAVCTDIERMKTPSNDEIRRFLETRMQPYRLLQADGDTQGLITGYYEPRLKGALTPSPEFPYAIYGIPDDLITVDLASVYPELKGLRLRGRLDGKRLVPYYSQKEMQERQFEMLNGKALAWVADPVELAFLHVQGSGRIDLPDGSQIRVGYADQNGLPYKSMGKWLIEQGELKADQVSMQGIQAWAKAHPERLPELLAANPSFVFFRTLPNKGDGPIGALGIPLSDAYSVAIDPKFVPLGVPMWLATTWPASEQTLTRLVLAQDTGGAIRGPVRADFFWGFGPEAGQLAGRMKQKGRLWFLWPLDTPLPNLGS